MSTTNVWSSQIRNKICSNVYNSYFFTWQTQDDFYSTVGELCHLMRKYVVF